MNSKQTFTEFTTAPCKCHHCSLVFFFSFALFLCQTVVFSITSVFVLQAAVVPTLVSVISQRLAFAAVWWSTSSRKAFFWCASSNCFLRNSFLNWEFFKILEVLRNEKSGFFLTLLRSPFCVCVCGAIILWFLAYPKNTVKARRFFEAQFFRTASGNLQAKSSLVHTTYDIFGLIWGRRTINMYLSFKNFNILYFYIQL